MQAAEIRALIEQGLPQAEVMVQGDDGVHFEAVVVDAGFVGKSMIEQHRMVFALLGDRVQNGSIHALSLKTFTPAQWQAKA